ncbi:uncharacterized protein RMCFA_1959 [Mycolicibacterium fortuitum subsp. acetamidolyticum]|uniref:Uncharacterized protein n=1 Tax=Mycolicibacterium fortuitum subsp. acetamidolyticum TaxID=144550 RepID=A0A100WPB2_MYCFO|nr:uncharacterized protein RMCFA_1959 [Mycolicibacterium fortuitum subsp. acetamidolyticum]
MISKTAPEDWRFVNARSVRVNGKRCSERDARVALASTSVGVVSVTLGGDVTDQEFEFSFRIANSKDLAGVDQRLTELIEGRSLTISAIDSFIIRTEKFETARYYRDGLANYFYGVLARERSSESGLVRSSTDVDAYKHRFDDAVERLGKFDRPTAEAICGLVAFHYNQFDLALRKTRSPRIARVARRFASLLGATPDTSTPRLEIDKSSLDYVLSDTEIERIITWCAIPLDGCSSQIVDEIERSLSDIPATDALKLRVIAAEHHLAAGEPARGMDHLMHLRHARALEGWCAWYRERAGNMST